MAGRRASFGLVVFALISRADTVELKTGERVDGVFKQATSAGVVIEVAGQSVTIPLNKVGAIYFGAPKPAASPTSDLAADALDALRALRTVTGSGIAYRDYAQRVLEAKIKVDKYRASITLTEAQEKIPINQLPPELEAWSHIGSSMFMYEHASQMWNTWLTSSESARKIMAESKLGPIDKRLAEYWKMASEELAKAEEASKR